jgi:hypothetical protein
MKKVTNVIILNLFFSMLTSAQQPAKLVFVELGGPGITSVNYDMRFTKSEKGIGGRVGVGYFGINDNGDRIGVTTLPIGLNYLLSKNEKNYFEVGAGFTSVFGTETFSSEKTRFSGSFGHLNFGYRLQPKDGGFVFRASINPVFGSGFFIPYWGGVSFGYKF